MVIKTNFGTKPASESDMGIVRFATPDEVTAGVNTDKAVNSKGVKSAIDSLSGQIYDITLLASNWVGVNAPYTYTITSITGINQDTHMHTILAPNVNINQISAFREAVVIDGGLATDTIIFKALGNKPTINIPLKIIVSKSLYLDDNYEPQYEVASLPRATTDIYGTVRIATPFDVEEGNSNIRVITPLLLKKNLPSGVAGLDSNSLIDDDFISDNIARVDSPSLIGTPTAPTANLTTNNNQIATTKFVHNSVNTKTKTYILELNQEDVDISDIWINNSDILTVFINRLYSIEDVHYTKNTSTKTITITDSVSQGDSVVVIVKPI